MKRLIKFDTFSLSAAAAATLQAAWDALKTAEQITRPPQRPPFADVDGEHHGAEQLAEREAEQEVWEPHSYEMCPCDGQLLALCIQTSCPHAPVAADTDEPLADDARCAEDNQPAAWCRNLPHDGADQLAEREAEEEVWEPQVKCPMGGDCPIDCDRTQPGCLKIWGSDAEYAEALAAAHDRLTQPAEREAEEEVREPKRIWGVHDWFDVSGGPGGAAGVAFPAFPEPDLTGDELVAVRQLIEERFPLHTTDSSLNTADMVGDDTPAGVEDIPPDPSPAGHLTFEGWAVPAILTVLLEHRHIIHEAPWHCSCGYDAGDELESIDWRDHVAPLIAARIACDPERAAAALLTDFNTNN